MAIIVLSESSIKSPSHMSKTRAPWRADNRGRKINKRGVSEGKLYVFMNRSHTCPCRGVGDAGWCLGGRWAVGGWREGFG